MYLSISFSAFELKPGFPSLWRRALCRVHCRLPTLVITCLASKLLDNSPFSERNSRCPGECNLISRSASEALSVFATPYKTCGSAGYIKHPVVEIHHNIA